MKYLKKSILLCLLMHTLHSSNGTILVKFNRVAAHYRIHSDPKEDETVNQLDSLDVGGREALCRTVIDVKQFTYDTASARSYERENRKHGLDSSNLQNQLCTVKMSWGDKVMNCLQCVNTNNVKWFVAYGPAGKCMYLLEPSPHSYREETCYRMTGLFDPSAVINRDKSALYFFSQMKHAKDKMEAICKLEMDDILRLCGAVFDTLDDHVQSHLHVYFMNIRIKARCRKCIVKGRNLNEPVNALPCQLNRVSSIHLFFVLADGREKGAVFVFNSNTMKEKVTPTLTLHSRMTGIGALLNPVDLPKDEKLRTDNVDAKGQTSNSTRKKSGRKRKSRRDSESASDDEYDSNVATKKCKKHSKSERKRERKKGLIEEITTDEEFDSQ